MARRGLSNLRKQMNKGQRTSVKNLRKSRNRHPVNIGGKGSGGYNEQPPPTDPQHSGWRKHAGNVEWFEDPRMGGGVPMRRGGKVRPRRSRGRR